MNQDDILKQIERVFKDFDIHKRMPSELLEIIKGSGYEQKLFKLLLVRMKQLNQLGVRAANLAEFEQINDEIYSMHMSQKEFNIRILYGFLPNGVPTLLLCFFERGGKRATNYSSQIPTAVERLRERKEACENE